VLSYRGGVALAQPLHFLLGLLQLLRLLALCLLQGAEGVSALSEQALLLT
jgi:hypothetical protein